MMQRKLDGHLGAPVLLVMILTVSLAVVGAYQQPKRPRGIAKLRSLVPPAFRPKLPPSTVEETEGRNTRIGEVPSQTTLENREAKRRFRRRLWRRKKRGATDCEPLQGAISLVDEEDEVLEQCRLEMYQAMAGPLASSFIPSTFAPPQGIWRNGHVQTIGGILTREIPEFNYVRDNDYRPIARALLRKAVEPLKRPSQNEEDGAESSTSSLSWWDRREKVNTPDGDWFHADYKFAEQPTTDWVVLLHGLEANSESALTRDFASAYHDMNVVCLNFRGCSSGGMNQQLGGYHLGFTSDLLYFLEDFRRRSQGVMPNLYLVAFSLGGNIALKGLGQLGPDAVDLYNIRACSVACPPIDQERDIQFLDRPGFNQRVYGKVLLNTLRSKVDHQFENLCDSDPENAVFDYDNVQSAKTVREFDEAFITKVYNFKDVEQYWRQNSCIHWFDSIAVPTYVLRAADDPLMDPAVFPLYKTYKFGGKAPILLSRTMHGGHLGFCLHKEQLNQSGEDGLPLKTGWLASEMARFIRHVRQAAARSESSEPITDQLSKPPQRYPQDGVEHPVRTAEPFQ